MNQPETLNPAELDGAVGGAAPQVRSVNDLGHALLLHYNNGAQSYLPLDGQEPAQTHLPSWYFQ